jgi:hypothetical protein
MAMARTRMLSPMAIGAGTSVTWTAVTLGGRTVTFRTQFRTTEFTVIVTVATELPSTFSHWYCGRPVCLVSAVTPNVSRSMYTE